MLAETKVIVVLRQLDHLAPCRVKRPVRETVLVRQERFFLGGVEPGVRRFVKMALGVQLGQRGLNQGFVPQFGGADEVVIGEIELGGKGLPGRGQFIAIRLRILAFRLGGLLHFLAVLIGARQKKHFVPQARCARAMTSVMTFSYAWPRCGWPFT